MASYNWRQLTTLWSNNRFLLYSSDKKVAHTCRRRTGIPHPIPPLPPLPLLKKAPYYSICYPPMNNIRIRAAVNSCSNSSFPALCSGISNCWHHVIILNNRGQRTRRSLGAFHIVQQCTIITLLSRSYTVLWPYCNMYVCIISGYETMG